MTVFYEFPLMQEHVHDFLECKDQLKGLYREENGTYYIRLRWNLITLFGTKDQLIEYDAFRRKYISTLLNTYCKPYIDCNMKLIGSVSPKSNIDVDLTCPNHFEDVLQNIYNAHKKEYPYDSLEEMFDVNIYGSIYYYLTTKCKRKIKDMRHSDCYPKYISNYRQRMWSFVRITEYINELSKQEKEKVLSTFPEPYKRLYERTNKEILQKINRNKNLYGKRIHVYLQELQKKPSPHPEEIAEKFSRAKFLEDDAYYSVGAVLHIVEDYKDIDRDSLYDSFYDNLGFLYEVLLKKNLCSKDSLSLRIVKLTKYVERIYDAIDRIKGGHISPIFRKIAQVSTRINKLRKKMITLHTMTPHITKFMALLHITNPSALSILIALTKLFFEELPQDVQLRNF